MTTAPVFKETVTTTHDKKVARKGTVFLVATAEIAPKKYTAYLQVPDTITAEERRILFLSLWNDLRPRVQKQEFKAPPPVKETKAQADRKKAIAYAILAVIAVLILLSIFL